MTVFSGFEFINKIADYRINENEQKSVVIYKYI